MLGDFVRGRQALAQFDSRVQLGIMLHRHIDSHTDSHPGVSELRASLRPPFMRYAERRGLFAAYLDEAEILHSLRGVGRRLSRSNPLHRVDEIWDEFEPKICGCFEAVFNPIQSEVGRWLKSKSTISGS